MDKISRFVNRTEKDESESENTPMHSTLKDQTPDHTTSKQNSHLTKKKQRQSNVRNKILQKRRRSVSQNNANLNCNIAKENKTKILEEVMLMLTSPHHSIYLPYVMHQKCSLINFVFFRSRLCVWSRQIFNKTKG